MLVTLVLIGIVLIARAIMIRKLTSKIDMSPTTRRTWIVTTRNAALFLILLIILFIWFAQLRAIAAAIVVVAAAIVVATKEFLLNIVGFFYQSASKFIAIGDRIEVDGTRGDVIDQNLMGLTLLEIGPGDKSHQHTGLNVFVPNSKLLSAAVRNETHMWGDYVFHLIRIPVSAESDWKTAESALLRAAHDTCAPYLDHARHAMVDLASKHSLDEPTVEPRVQLHINEPGRIDMVLRVPVPTRKRGRAEQDISRRYLENLKRTQTYEAQ